MKIKKPGLSGKEWIKRLEKKNAYISSYAKDLLNSKDFKTSKESFDHEVVKVSDLGFTSYPTTKELFARAKEKGYDLCPPEAGPIILETLEKGDWMYIAMEPIADSDGRPSVFRVERHDGGGFWLHAAWSRPGDEWDLGARIVFRLRKSSDSETKTLPSDTSSLALRMAALEEFKAKVETALSTLLK